MKLAALTLLTRLMVFTVGFMIGQALLSRKGHSEEWKMMELRESYVDYAHYTWAVEPFLAPTFKPTNRFDLSVNLDLLGGAAFLDNRVHSETDEWQFRKVGWNYRLGVHVGQSLDLFFDHFSQHLLDYPTLMPQTYDAVGARIYFYRRNQ